MTQRLRGDGGAVTTELVLVTPVLVVLLLLIMFAGRMGTARNRVINASRDAARAASIERSPEAARDAAYDAALATLAGKDVTCEPLDVAADVSDFRPGGDVAVTVTCQILLADLSLLAIPGSRQLTSTSVEVVDTFRAASG